MNGKLKQFWSQWRGETLMFIATCFTTLIAVFSLISQFGSPIIVLLVSIGAILILLLFMLLINVKRFYRLRFDQLDHVFGEYKARVESADKIIIDLFGYAWRENQYFRRLQHFVDEKKLLARVLVENAFPVIFRRIADENVNLQRINLILDSGSTITPVFQNLVHTGLPNIDDITIEIFTNNLAGIDEIHKLQIGQNEALTERAFNLVGGQPLNKYRATTGAFTQQVLAGIWEEQSNSEGEIINICVITANWFIGSRRLNKLDICARGEGHFELKEALVTNCQYIIVLTPLGKILRIDSVDELNAIIEHKYEAFTLPAEKRNNTFLVTSFRPHISASPLSFMSNELEGVKNRNESNNFIFFEDIPEFEPANNRLEAILIDLPHTYAREKFFELFGQRLNLD